MENQAEQKKEAVINSLKDEFHESVTLRIRDFDFLTDFDGVRVADAVELRDVRVFSGIAKILFRDGAQRVAGDNFVDVVAIGQFCFDIGFDECRFRPADFLDFRYNAVPVITCLGDGLDFEARSFRYGFGDLNA